MQCAIFIFTIFYSLFVHANSSIDSLLKQIAKTKTDSVLCQIYLDCGDFYENINVDSAEFYYIKAQKLCEKILKNNKHLNNSELVKFSDLYSKALRYRAILYLNNKIINKPIEKFLNLSLSFAKIAKNEKAQASCYSNLGVFYFDRSIYDKALECQYNALRIFEKIKYNQGLANVYMNIANIYTIQYDYEKALTSFKRSLNYLNNEYLIARVENNMAILYKDLKKYDIAEQHFIKSLEIFKLYKDSINIANIYTNLGVLSYQKNNYSSSLDYYSKAFQIFQAKKDTSGIILSLLNMSESLIAIYQNNKTKDISLIQKSQKYSLMAFNINKKYRSIYYNNAAARNLMRTFSYLGNSKKAIYFAELYALTKDTLFSKEKSKTIAEIETKYKTEKQQRLIEKLKFQKEITQKKIETQELENKRQRTTIYAIISVVLLLCILLVVVVYFLRTNQIKNRKLRTQNHQILKQKEEIIAQRDEIAEQRDIVTKQKIQIEAYHKSLKDSIYYAENIQKAVIPDSSYVENILGNCFVLFQPRDIVSGDFYWVQKDNDYIYIAVADCTGHGVPGAFMSMMAISFLNDLFHKKSITQANQVLELLRQHLIKSLHLNEHSAKMKDGMDMIFVIYDKKRHILNYSGANNPLYIVRKTKEGISDLIEINPDKMPVGYHPNMLPFKNHEIILSEEDIIYFTTDGYVDQFGGTHGKKFLRKNLKILLTSISALPLQTQKEILLETLHKWQIQEITYSQTDDITIIGWKIT